MVRGMSSSPDCFYLLQVYKSAEDRYMYFDKNFGRSVKVPEMLGGKGCLAG